VCFVGFSFRDLTVEMSCPTCWGALVKVQVLLTRAVESESEGILGGVGVGRNFRWSRSRKEC
jgi:hypothetical protein